MKSYEIFVGVNARVISDLIGDGHAEVRAVHLREEIEIREDRFDHAVVVRGNQGSLQNAQVQLDDRTDRKSVV